jgi:hypothetical protein
MSIKSSTYYCCHGVKKILDMDVCLGGVDDDVSLTVLSFATIGIGSSDLLSARYKELSMLALDSSESLIRMSTFSANFNISSATRFFLASSLWLTESVKASLAFNCMYWEHKDRNLNATS